MSEVTDTEEKRRALDAISLRFDARCPRPTPDAALARVNILRIDVESLTCRHKNGATPQGQGIESLCFFGTNWRKGLVLCGESPYIEVVREKKAAPALEPTRKGPSPLS